MPLIVAQSKFTITMPSVDTATPPNPLVIGELSSVTVEISAAGGPKVQYTAPLSSTAAVGANEDILFSGLTQVGQQPGTAPFVPVAGTTYTADAFVTDDVGNSADSQSITWTQNAASAAPAAPTNFGVA